MASTIDIKKKEYKDFGIEAKQVANVERFLPSSFADTFISHMQRLKCSDELLAEKSLIATKTIQRMRYHFRYKPKLETIIAICIGLELHPRLSMDLIQKSGHLFQPCNEEHIIYQMLLYRKYQCSIYECNEILRANGIKPLGKEE